MMSCFRWVSLSVLLPGFAAAGPHVINSAGSRIEGVAIQSSADGTVLLTTVGGQTLSFGPGAYRLAVAKKPREMEEVEAMVKKRDLAAAASLLRQVKEQYRFLGWDLQAGRMLARVELAQNNFPAAAAEYEELFALQPQLKTEPSERSRYMQALLGAGRIQEVSTLVDEDIAFGTREAAARAQIVRGDMKFAAGQTEEALLDYLRTALLFQDQPDARPEALYKTAVALKKMNDSRAADYFQKVVEEFPDSDFAEQIREEKK